MKDLLMDDPELLEVLRTGGAAFERQVRAAYAAGKIVGRREAEAKSAQLSALLKQAQAIVADAIPTADLSDSNDETKAKNGDGCSEANEPSAPAGAYGGVINRVRAALQKETMSGAAAAIKDIIDRVNSLVDPTQTLTPIQVRSALKALVKRGDALRVDRALYALKKNFGKADGRATKRANAVH